MPSSSMMSHAAVNHSFLQSMTHKPHAAAPVSSSSRQDEVDRNRFKLVSEDEQRQQEKQTAEYAATIRKRTARGNTQAWGSANVSQEQRSRTHTPSLTRSMGSTGRSSTQASRSVSHPRQNVKSSSRTTTYESRGGRGFEGTVSGLNEANLAQERARELGDEVSGLRQTVRELKETLAASGSIGSSDRDRGGRVRSPQPARSKYPAVEKSGEHVVDAAFLGKVEQLRVDHENNLDLIELLMKEKMKSDDRAKRLEASLELQSRSTRPSEPQRRRPLRERKKEAAARPPRASPAVHDSDDLWKATVAAPSYKADKENAGYSSGLSSGLSSRDSDEAPPYNPHSIGKGGLLSDDDDAFAFGDQGGDESAPPPASFNSDDDDDDSIGRQSPPPSHSKASLRPVQCESPPQIQSELGWADRVRQSYAASAEEGPSKPRRKSKTVDIDRLTRHTASSASMTLKGKRKDPAASSGDNPLNMTLRQKRKADERQREEDEQRRASRFKARPVPKSTGTCKLQQSSDRTGRFVSMPDKEHARREKIQARAAKLNAESSLPPRMQRQDNTDPGASSSARGGRRHRAGGDSTDRPAPFRAKAVPDFEAQQTKWEKTKEKVKGRQKETKIATFSMMNDTRKAEEDSRRQKRDQRRASKENEIKQAQLDKVNREKKLVKTLETMHKERPSKTTNSVQRRSDHNLALVDKIQRRERDTAPTNFDDSENIRDSMSQSSRASRGKADPHAAVDEKARQKAKEEKIKYKQNLKDHKEKVAKSLQGRPSLIARQQNALEKDAAKREALKTVAMTVYGDEQGEVGNKWKKLAKNGDLFDETEKGLLGLHD
jgi:hypothetical protein